MQQIVRIAGMHCNGCVARVTKAVKAVAPDATVTLDPPQAVFSADPPVSVEKVVAAITAAGYEASLAA